jgi:TolB protein
VRRVVALLAVLVPLAGLAGPGPGTASAVDRQGGPPIYLDPTGPSWSPDGGHVAFSSDGIYVVKTDGTGLRRVARVHGSDHDQYPSWSPDGRRIAFSTYASGPGPVEIHVVNASGSDDHVVYRSPTDWSSRGHPVWSPDGARIAFVCRQQQALCEIGADGSALRIVTRATGPGFPGYLDSPAWSPDGKRIAFVETAPSSVFLEIVDENGTGRRRLVQLSARSGTGARRLTCGHDDYGPAWSPDGSRIAFYRGDDFEPERPFRFCNRCRGIWIVGADGRGLQRVVAG